MAAALLADGETVLRERAAPARRRRRCSRSCARSARARTGIPTTIHAVRIDARTVTQPRGALRPRAQDARVVPGARPAARALRQRARLGARRLRDRRAAGRPAPEGPARRSARRSRSTTATSRRAAARAARRARRVRRQHRERHAERDDGRRASPTARRVIENAAREPEVMELARRAPRDGRRDPRRRQRPHRDRRASTSLRGVQHTVAGDRIEAGTLLAAALITRGDVRVRGVDPGDLLESTLEKLRETRRRDRDRGRRASRVRLPTAAARASSVVTAPFPGFPTDMQAQIMAVLCAGARAPAW